MPTLTHDTRATQIHGMTAAQEMVDCTIEAGTTYALETGLRGRDQFSTIFVNGYSYRVRTDDLYQPGA